MLCIVHINLLNVNNIVKRRVNGCIGLLDYGIVHTSKQGVDMKEVNFKSLVIVGGNWTDTSDAYIESGYYEDGTEIEDSVLDELTNECDLSQMLFDRG